MQTEHLRRAYANARAADLDRSARAALLAPPPPVLRAVRREDRGALGDFFAGLSPASRRRRFLASTRRLSDAELARYADVDHRSADGLLAVSGRDGRVVGFAQYATWDGRPGVADFAIAVADEWQGRGLGLRLGAELARRARAHGVSTLTATTFADNAAARRLLGRLGFAVRGRQGPEVELALAL
jgi:acetyltransferase